jgi:hypothetical protein
MAELFDALARRNRLPLASFSPKVERINGCEVYTDKGGNFLLVENGKPLNLWPANTKRPQQTIIEWVYARNREQAMRRDSFRCVHCSSRQNLQCHHIVHRGIAGGNRDDRIENLQTLCQECHAKEH